MIPIDWTALFVPSVSILELVIRGSAMYLGILMLLRLFRRDAGSLSPADLLVLVLVADAAQNAMTSDYRSITEGAVLVATVFSWNYLIDWLSFHVPAVHRLMNPTPLPLIIDGALMRRNMRAQLITLDDLKEQLREQGVEHISDVKRCAMEGDGNLSIIRRDSSEQAAPKANERQKSVAS